MHGMDSASSTQANTACLAFRSTVRHGFLNYKFNNDPGEYRKDRPRRSQQNVAASAFAEIPEAKIRQFAAGARSLDLTSLNDMPERKRLVLADALNLLSFDTLVTMTKALQQLLALFWCKDLRTSPTNAQSQSSMNTII